MLTLTRSPASEEVTTTLTQLLQQHTYTLLYFYPKDDTPGCTLEGQEFSLLLKDFLVHQIGIYGISRDTHASHCSFQKKHHISLPLISDAGLLLHKQFGARGEKTSFGKTSMGVLRSTVLLDKQGTVLHHRRNVKASGHASNVLKRVTTHLTK